MYEPHNLAPLYGPDNPPFKFAGDIQQGTLPPDLDTAYRAAFWAARFTNEILSRCHPEVVPYCDAPVPLIFLFDKWAHLIDRAVRDVADEIALARGTRKPIRCGSWTGATCHDIALQCGNFTFGILGRGLSNAAKLPVVSTVETPPYRELFAEHWPAIAPSVADVPKLGARFFAALKLEALRTMKHRRRQQPAAAEPPANGTRTEHRPLTREERETAVAAYLRDNPDAKCKQVAKGIGAATGAVSQTAAWQAAMGRRKANRPQPKPRERQLINPEQSTLLADNRNPVDEVIDAEETRAVRWRQLLESADAQQRGALNRLGESKRAALLNYAEVHGEEKTKEMIATIAEQSIDESSERRGRRRRS